MSQLSFCRWIKITHHCMSMCFETYRGHSHWMSQINFAIDIQGLQYWPLCFSYPPTCRRSVKRMSRLGTGALRDVPAPPRGCAQNKIKWHALLRLCPSRGMGFIFLSWESQFTVESEGGGMFVGLVLCKTVTTSSSHTSYMISKACNCTLYGSILLWTFFLMK